MAKASSVVSLLLRFLAAAATLCATIVMSISHETITLFGLTFEAKFQYTEAFIFFVIANAIGCAYTVLALFIPPTSSLSKVLIMTDVVIAFLLTSAVAAAGAVSELGKQGNSHAGWMPICDQMPSYCDHVSGALICAFVGAVTYLVILLHSIRLVLTPLLP